MVMTARLRHGVEVDALSLEHIELWKGRFFSFRLRLSLYFFFWWIWLAYWWRSRARDPLRRG